MTSLIVAHGGSAGLVFEAVFLVLPVVIFGTLALISRRRSSDDQGSNDDADDELGTEW